MLTRATHFEMEKYCKIKVLGSGAFGKAWLVSCSKTEQAFVIKEISIPALKERDKQQAINEVKILATLKHKNIVMYKEAFVHEKCLCITMEYADDGKKAYYFVLEKKVLYFDLVLLNICKLANTLSLIIFGKNNPRKLISMALYAFMYKRAIL